MIERLARSQQARKVTRWAMEHLWAPVGTGVRPQQETDFVISWLFGDEGGRAAAEEIEEAAATNGGAKEPAPVEAPKESE